MSAEQVLDIGRETVWIMIQLSGPAMAAALVVGVAISLLQAMTQVQETTLAFLPKAAAVIGAVLLTLPFAIAVLKHFTEQLYGRIAGMGGT